MLSAFAVQWSLRKLEQVSHAKFKPETKLSPPQGQPTGQGVVRGPACVVSSEVCVSSWVLWGKKRAAELVVTTGLSQTSVAQAPTSGNVLGLVFRALVQLGQVFTKPEPECCPLSCSDRGSQTFSKANEKREGWSWSMRMLAFTCFNLLYHII